MSSVARPAVVRNESGSVMVEYVVLLCAVTIGCSLAVMALGVPLVRLYVAQQVWLMLAVP